MLTSPPCTPSLFKSYSSYHGDPKLLGERVEYLAARIQLYLPPQTNPCELVSCLGSFFWTDLWLWLPAWAPYQLRPFQCGRCSGTGCTLCRHSISSPKTVVKWRNFWLDLQRRRQIRRQKRVRPRQAVQCRRHPCSQDSTVLDRSGCCLFRARNNSMGFFDCWLWWRQLIECHAQGKLWISPAPCSTLHSASEKVKNCSF